MTLFAIVETSVLYRAMRAVWAGSLGTVRSTMWLAEVAVVGRTMSEVRRSYVSVVSV
jgi:hypothetical protein